MMNSRKLLIGCFNKIIGVAIMYQAELNGKSPSEICRMEDILTSNVFSFLKYSNRSIFLKKFLEKLGLNMGKLLIGLILIIPGGDKL